MSLRDVLNTLDDRVVGQTMHDLVRELYPICRSITGDGVRQTLARLGNDIPLDVHEVPTGTPVYDWTVPSEWNIRDAWVKNVSGGGEKVIDFAESNLHVVSYSTPIHRTMPLAELREHLHTLPDQPGLIPYRASHYRDGWGFCLSHHMLESLPEGDYEVCIDATLEDGHLTYGECVLPGETEDEVLVSCHVCHPSLCNDNLSGIVLAQTLAGLLKDVPRRLSYRFVFVPGTIGSITWLSRNESTVENIKHGLVLTCVGDPGGFTYKRSRRGDATIDRVFAHLLASGDGGLRDFSPYGYDERQYCSPGFNLPVGCLMRTPFGEFDEYHTSADNPDFVTPDALAGSLRLCLEAIEVLERNRICRNLKPHGEPQLGKRGLYDRHDDQPTLSPMALLWVLNLSDGEHDLLAIADRSGLPFAEVANAAEALLATDLLEDLDD